MSIFSLFAKRPDLEQGIKLATDTPNGILLDVRTPEEYAQGHLPQSINLPLDRIQTIRLDKDKPLFVYCMSGARSSQACSYLNRQKYTATNIGGIAGYRGTTERGKAK